MRLTPRGEEVAEVVALLERSDYASAEELAKDVIKTVADFLQYREWFWLVHQGANAQVAFGPYASESEAASEATKGFNAADRAGDNLLFTVRTAPLSRAEHRAGGGAGYCTSESCGHPPYMHSLAGSGRGKCLLSACGCDKYLNLPKKTRTTKGAKK